MNFETMTVEMMTKQMGLLSGRVGLVVDVVIAISSKLVVATAKEENWSKERNCDDEVSNLIEHVTSILEFMCTRQREGSSKKEMMMHLKTMLSSLDQLPEGAGRFEA